MLKQKIYNCILNKEKEFTILEIFEELKEITNDKKIILNILDELYERGLVNFVKLENNVRVFESIFLK